jgi:hypothetical protein
MSIAPTLVQASWTHGTGVQLESSSWSALRQGFFTTIRPSNEGNSAWVHFAIPTPVIVNNVRLRAVLAGLRVATGPAAHIGSFHVYDGEKKITDLNGLNVRGALQFVQYAVPGRPEVLWGTGISLLIVCDANVPDAWVHLVSAGIDFQSP